MYFTVCKRDFLIIKYRIGPFSDFTQTDQNVAQMTKMFAPVTFEMHVLRLWVQHMHLAPNIAFIWKL